MAFDASLPNKKTGPYRRVFANPNMAAVQATISLPGNGHGITYGQDSDAAYIYTGGWGAGDKRAALDAGFMHNPVSDSWSLFIKYQGIPFNFGSTSNIRLLPNQQVVLSFSIPEDGVIRVETSGEGVDVDTGDALGVRSFVVQQTGCDGFVSSGVDVILKRMTSIAQDKADNFTSGSKLIGVTWSDVKFGATLDQLTNWVIASPRESTTYPVQPTPHVLVNYQNDTWETVSIDLSP